MTSGTLPDPRPDPAPVLLYRPVTLIALRKRASYEIDTVATETEAAALADHLGLVGLDNLTVTATITASGRDMWRLAGIVRASVIQTCVVTLSPVSSNIEEAFNRVFTEDADAAATDDLDFDPTTDDPPEYVATEIDVGASATETLALAIDPYPRADGAAFTAVTATPPDAAPISDADVKPFAGLAALRKSLQNDN